MYQTSGHHHFMGRLTKTNSEVTSNSNGFKVGAEVKIQLMTAFHFRRVQSSKTSLTITNEKENK